MNEASRQQSLDSYRLLDSMPEASYDEIVELASLICDAPIAMVSLIDRERQWFKARKGFAAGQTRRDEAFCHHAIQAPTALMVVPDTHDDPRFVENALVTGENRVRFYAGMPLVTPCGAAIGAVCVLDRKPRILDARQRAGLASLARLTMSIIENRQHERELVIEGVLSAAVHVAPAMEIVAAGESPCTVAIFELQDYAGAVRRAGERAIERALDQLDSAFVECLRPGSGDSVTRVSGTPEIVGVLHGPGNAAALQVLRGMLPEFEHRTSLRVLCASADSNPVEEALHSVFQRADLALTCVKDEMRAH